jgi:hypothetical protein
VWLVRGVVMLKTCCRKRRQPPPQIAALDGASRGWPAATLRPVAAAVASRYREDATRMLAGPMERAVAYGHSEAGDIIWEALVQGPPEPERCGMCV